MSRTFKLFSTSIIAFSASLLADGSAALEVSLADSAPVVINAEESPAINYEAPAVKPRATVKKAEPFQQFTGKIKGKKVRMRSNPDMESSIVTELHRGDLVAVVGDHGDFWAVQPPADTKAYVFRSFVLDNVVEGNRVNVRLQPNLDAAIIGNLNAGDKVQGTISAANNKWLEIPVPQGTHFYIAKEYVVYEGAPELKEQHDKRQKTVNQLLDAASLLAKSELKKSFNQIDFDRVTNGFKIIVDEYSDFPKAVEAAQTELTAVQEEYLQKRLSYLEEKASSASADEAQEVAATPARDLTERMKMWEVVEEALYQSWATRNDNQSKTLDEFYQEQKLSAVPLTGIVEVYQTAAKSQPGDFIIKENNLPKACVYSTKVDLQKYVGKKVTLYGVERSNNNFAFNAYYVVDVE